MKHGNKAKKSAKAVKASGKKSSSKEAVAKPSKESGRSAKTQSSKEAVAKKAGGEAAKAAVKTPAKESAGKVSGGNGKAKAGSDSGSPSFANPVVGNSFKRAVKKYSNAFRRLTD